MIPFEQSLRKLAEREPEKFWFGCNMWGGVVKKEIFWWRQEGIPKYVTDLTQDDLDEILALVGYEVEVGKTWVHLGDGRRRVAPHWQFMVWKKDTPTEGEISELGERESFPDKLSAAKGALIAVVEHLEKARG